MANASNCVIHITELDINKPEGTIITPVSHDQQPRVIFIRYINELHYVSTVPYKNGPNKNRLAYLKSKLSQSEDQKTAQLKKTRNCRSTETNDARQKRLANLRQNNAKQGLKKQIRIDTKD